MKYLFSILALSLFLFSCTEVVEYDTTADSLISGKYTTMKVSGDYIYAITDSELVTIDNSDKDMPQEIDRITLGGQLENLYLDETVIFIGSTTDLHILEIQNNGLVEKRSSTEHIDFASTPNVNPCDPAIANNDIAYVTLSSVQPDNQAPCGGSIIINELKIYNVENLNAPVLVETIPLDSPQGLAIDGDFLFVTNLNTGTDVFSIDHQGNVTLVNHIEGGAHDVIATDNTVRIVSSSKINQYNYSNIQSIIKIGSITL
jgi:hypothetical protein